MAGRPCATPIQRTRGCGADGRGRDRGREKTRPVALDAAGRRMGARRMSRVDVFRMIKRRVKTVGLGEANCHTFRATGITAYLLNGGTLERAQAIAAHESPRTTKLYDRTADGGDHRGYREDRDLSGAIASARPERGGTPAP